MKFFSLPSFSGWLCLILTLFIWQPTANAQSHAEIVYWESVRDSDNPKLLELYIQKYRNGFFRELAEIKIIELKNNKKVEEINSGQLCDRLAGNPSDPEQPTNGAVFSKLKTNPGPAIEACRKAIKTKNPRYLYQLGRALLANGENTNGISALKRAVEGNNRMAIYWLAEYHRQGKYGLPKDALKALNLHKKNGELKDARSIFRIGWIYHNGGPNVARDLEKAYHSYKSAEQMNNPDVFYPLGLMYERGNYVRKNTDTAIKYYRKSLANSKFYKKTIGRRLGSLLAVISYAKLINLDDKSDYLREFGKLNEGFDLQKMNLGKKLSHHNDLIDGIILVIEKLHDKIDDNVTGKTATGSVTLQDILIAEESLVKRLSEAVNARYKAFPSQFAAQTSANTSNIIADITKSHKYFISWGQKWKDLSRKVDAHKKKYGTKPGKCLKGDRDWQNRVYTYRLKNRCNFAVSVNLNIEIENSKYANTQKSKSFTLKSNQTKELSASTRRGGKATARVEFRSCYGGDTVWIDDDNKVRCSALYNSASANHYADYRRKLIKQLGTLKSY